MVQISFLWLMSECMYTQILIKTIKFEKPLKLQNISWIPHFGQSWIHSLWVNWYDAPTLSIHHRIWKHQKRMDCFNPVLFRMLSNILGSNTSQNNLWFYLIKFNQSHNSIHHIYYSFILLLLISFPYSLL